MAAALEETTGRDMNAPANIEIPTLPGTPVAGGFFAGLIRIGDETFALVVAPKAAGYTRKAWGEYGKTIEGARSYTDGMANTVAMAEAGSALAQWTRELNIDGHDDWYIPSRDELEICYRNLKPTETENYCSFRDGDNPSSVPVGYPYTEQNPAQTACSAFQEGGEEAFDANWHWSSTQYSATNACLQHFNDGRQDTGRKYYEFSARAVRRFKVSN
jgi:hypothetical protein